MRSHKFCESHGNLLRTILLQAFFIMFRMIFKLLTICAISNTQFTNCKVVKNIVLEKITKLLW